MVEAVKNIITFSLWGNDPFYWRGAIKNIELANDIYGSEWECCFYCDDLVPFEATNELEQGANVVYMGPAGGAWKPGFWKHRAILDEGVERIICRDTDSRLSLREKEAVDEWIDSGLPFHIMRDHVHHSVPIMGGTWGATKQIGTTIANLGSHWNGDMDAKQVDQEFLQRVVWPIVANQSCIHDEISLLKTPVCRPFPSPRKGIEFVGLAYDENDVPNGEQVQQLAEWLDRIRQ